MKRMLSLIVCLSLTVIMLVSCGGVIQPKPDHYPETSKPDPVLDINLYIVYEEGTTQSSLDTVGEWVKKYTEDEYKTVLNVVFCTQSEYAQVLLEQLPNPIVTEPEIDAAPDASVDGGDSDETTEEDIVYPTGNIALITSKELFDTLAENKSIVDIAPYLDTKQYGTLNVSIPGALLDSVTGKRVEVIDNQKVEFDTLFALPNTRLAGQYEYLVIDKEIAKQVLKYSEEKLNSYLTYEQTEQLRYDMEQSGYDSSRYVTTVYGNYALKAELESSGNICNVISAPRITADETLKSAYSIIDSGNDVVNERCMKILYALHNDSKLATYLVFGISSANYNVVDSGVELVGGLNSYYVDYSYSGSIYLLPYCAEKGWTAQMADIAKHQNNSAVAVK